MNIKKYLLLGLLGYWAFEIIRMPRRRRYFMLLIKQVPYIPFRYLT
ncbi:MAG TPA: hypothetical protein PLB81_06315 [Deltaproteobacteria bacterium]|nr:hypothetical protein [Deltaproteobacteria bacterium]